PSVRVCLVSLCFVRHVFVLAHHPPIFPYLVNRRRRLRPITETDSDVRNRTIGCRISGAESSNRGPDQEPGAYKRGWRLDVAGVSGRRSPAKGALRRGSRYGRGRKRAWLANATSASRPEPIFRIR